MISYHYSYTQECAKIDTMRFTEEDLKKIAELFKEFTMGKYKIVVVEKNQKDHIYDPAESKGQGMTNLVERTVLTSFNSVLNDKFLPVPIEKDITIKNSPKFDPRGNIYMWDTISKTLQ